MSKNHMVAIAETFQRADRALVTSPAFGVYSALENYHQSLQDAVAEKCAWPEGPEPRALTDAEYVELDRLWAVRAAAWADWSDLLNRAIRGSLSIDERTIAVREATRSDKLGAMFTELVGMMRAARRW